MHPHNVLVLLLLILISCLLLLLSHPTQGITNYTNPNITAVTNSSFFIAKPGCVSKCGEITVPYPFGMSTGCSMNYYLQLTCNTTYDPPKLFLGGLEVLSISQTQVRIRNIIASQCYNDTTNLTHYSWAGMEWGDEWPYTLSDTENKFTVIGCDVYGLISLWRQSRHSSTGCLSACSDSADVVGDNCTGIGCCQSNIPKGLKSYDVSLGYVDNHTEVLSFDPCIYSFLGEEDSFQFNGTSDFKDPNFMKRILDNVPVVLDFVIGKQTCLEAQNSSAFSCQNNSNCIDSNSGYEGYLCSCNSGYEGNPYLSPGCTDIDECNNTALILNNCVPNATCTNTQGGFNCKCFANYSGDGTTNGSGCVLNVTKDSQSSGITTKDLGIKLSLGLSFGFSALLMVVTGLYLSIQRRKEIKLREQFFRQNGGLLMKQKISSIDGTSSESFIFTAEELKKATNNYAESRILGRGGYGVVYKGILPDQRIVAIKKSRVMDGNQVEQFINELLILTQVNHKNVVKLLGCCFESEVPQLVYEYISNGTLFEHIHKTLSRLTLDDRLRIAVETAGALSYLHSQASIPIIHRDVKSANILLDANCMAKMADFGASRLVPLDRAQVTTLVQGTLGYLDPEYFYSSQLTEKSDVYSFGVVLAELLTGRNAVCLDKTNEERSLATYFIVSMKESRLLEILEPRLVREGTLEQLQAFAELVKRCLYLKSEERPSMKEVVTELEGLRKFKKDPWVNQQSHVESESFRNEKALADTYIELMSLSTNTSDISEQYSFNCNMTFPLDSPRY